MTMRNQPEQRATGRGLQSAPGSRGTHEWIPLLSADYTSNAVRVRGSFEMECLRQGRSRARLVVISVIVGVLGLVVTVAFGFGLI